MLKGLVARHAQLVLHKALHTHKYVWSVRNQSLSQDFLFQERNSGTIYQQ